MTESKDDNQKRVLEEALEQFVDLQLLNKEPDVDEFVKRYPEIEHQIRNRIRKIQKIHTLFDSLVQADDSDFEEATTECNLVGQKIGNFEIEKMIGRGGMGVVYLAHDTKLKRSVAIKSIPSELQADSSARTRFRREAELLASLNHPNISVIHEIIEEEDSGYLILEYVPGETLAERITREPLELKEALSLGQQVAKAISAAHKKGVIHRDLKPGNIKITPEENVKVLDFGLAKPFTRTDKRSDITKTEPGHVIGTPAYMSPEQARGIETDHRTDIWSFGCIMYQMLTGHLPFQGQTATDTLARIIEREPNWGLLPQNTPGSVRSLLRRCLEKDPNRRLVDIAEATKEINETLSKLSMAPIRRLRRIVMTVGVAIIIILSGIVMWSTVIKKAQSSANAIRIVVLPFENLGPEEDEYFADGITDAITARLAVVHGLGVISRQSAMQYKKREHSTQEIAKELGVDYVLEGTVQREQPSDPTSRVRIIPQLVRASDDIHVWAETYDDDMSEIFRLQSDLAERVAQALDITLLEPERQALRSKPTENTEAYEYYLRGNEYIYRGYTENNIRIAIQMYEKAVGLDPTFALAYTQLSKAHVDMYWYHYDRSEQRLAMAKQAVDKALELDTDMPEVYIALGWYYYHGDLDFGRALEQFAFARKSRPNNSELLTGISFVQRRQGRFEQAAETLEKALELDPLSSIIAANLGETFMLLRKYAEAEHYFDLAISLTPDWVLPHRWKALLYLLWEGRTEKARAVLDEALDKVSSTGTHFPTILVALDVYDGKYPEALEKLSVHSKDIDDQYYFIPDALRVAQLYAYMNKEKPAKEHYDEARSILEARIKEQPEDERLHSSLGLAYAGLGRKEDAMREGRRAVKMLPVSKDAMRGLSRIEDLARIYVMVGQYDAAITQLEFLLTKPSRISAPLLRLDPAWDPLRNHRHFKKLVQSEQ